MMLALGQLSNKPLPKLGCVTCISEAHSPPLVLVAGTWIGVITGRTLSVMVTRNVLGGALLQIFDAFRTTVVLPVGINLPKAEPEPVPLPLPMVAPLKV